LSEEERHFVVADYKGSWNIGAFGVATDKFVILGEGFRPKLLNEMKKVFKVPIIIQNVMDEPIVGVLLAANSRGILVPPQISDIELKNLEEKTGVPVEKIEFKTYENALGNILLVNDKVTFIHKDIAEKNKHVLKVIEDALDTEVITYKFTFPIIGTVVALNNKGALTHPMMTDEELEFIKKTANVRVGKGTVNMGSPYIRSGLIVNSHGVVVGLRTTGLEMHRAYEILIAEE